MTKFLILVLVAVSFQASLGKPAEQQLSTLGQNAKNLAQEVSNTLGLQNINSEKILKTINDQSKALVDNLNTIVNKLKTEYSAHEGQVDSAIKSVEDQLSKTANDLKSSLDPKTQQQIEETRRKFDDGVKTAATELSNFAKSVQENKQLQEAQTNVQNLAKSVLDSFVQNVKNAENQLKKAVADHEKTHKN